MNYSDKTEVLNLDDIKKTTKKNKKIFWFRVLPIILIPILGSMTIVSLHSTKLIIKPINYIVYILLSLFIYMLIVGFFILRKRKNEKTKKAKIKKIILNIIVALYIICTCTFLFLLYGPYDKFRTWFISTSMSTMSHQYIYVSGFIVMKK